MYIQCTVYGAYIIIVLRPYRFITSAVTAVRTVLHNSSTIHVTVDLHEARLFEFPCSAQSDDSTPVVVRWYRVDEENGDEIDVRVIPDKLNVTSNGSLIIQLTDDDQTGWAAFHGQYKCRASNLYSDAERVVFLRVNNYVPPGHYVYQFFSMPSL